MADLSVNDMVPLFEHDKRIRHVEQSVAELRAQTDQLTYSIRVEAPARHNEVLQAFKDLRGEIKDARPNYAAWASVVVAVVAVLVGLIVLL